MTFDELVSRLENVQRNPDGSITARCPAHDDRRSSLSARRGTRQPIVAYCFAGCSFIEIIRAAEFMVPGVQREYRGRR
jgi:hypothetical protein